MSYKIDGKDIVISGFEKGISDSPYTGLSDMRNVDIISVPGEASVTFSTTLSSQTNISSTTFTASNSGGDLLLTWSGSTSLPNNTAITLTNSGGSLPTGTQTNKAYYVVSTTTTTFKIALTATGTPITYTDAGTGTQSFATINIAQPKFIKYHYYTDTTNRTSNYLYYCIDSMGRIWYYYTASQWVYLNNLGGNEANAGVTDAGNGLEALGSYLIFFRTQNVGYIRDIDAGGVVQTIAYLTTSGNWTRAWKGLNNVSGYPINVSHYALLSPTDGNVYFCNGPYVGSILVTPATAFDPATASTYTFNESALALPSNEISNCLNQLVTNILVGGSSNVVYSWDRISVGYVPIFVAETNTVRIVVSNTNAYFFTGQRGRVYICNGSQAQLYKKIPDHLSGTVNPYYTWGDATFSRNQIYFSVQATDNTGTAINNYGGIWAIDVETEALRLTNQLSYGSYAGLATAILAIQGSSVTSGTGLLSGWYVSSTSSGIDKSASTPYTGGQSYVDTELIPIGTFIDPFTPSQVEWKTSIPIGSNGTSETISLHYRIKFSDSYTLIGTTTSATGLLTGGASSISDMYQTNFQKAQWVQLRAVLTSNATTPTYNRLVELRLRDYPSGRSNR